MIWPDLPTALFACSLFGLASAYVAHRRGKNALLWFATGFLFGLIGVVAIFFAPRPKKKEAPVAAARPEPFLAGPVDKFWYYLDAAHQRSSPMSHQAITREWKEGKLSPATFVWHEDLTEWTPLEKVVRS